MWKNIARALGLSIPDQQLDSIAPILDALWSQTRAALDRDLSSSDPAITFYAARGVRP